MSAEDRENLSPTRPFVELSAGVMVYYAAERTLMSWMRAALGMMALGFVIDRFGLVLEMLPNHGALSSTAYSFWTGSALVFGGAAMAFVAAARYTGLELRFRREGCRAPGHGLPLGVLFTLIVALIGCVIGFILVNVR